MAPPDSPDQPSAENLPAVYEDPLKALARDLRAVLASLRLLARQLWRRNREGSLWRPGFWPGALAALFWPLLLTLVAIALLALPLVGAAPESPLPTPSSSSSPLPSPSPSPRPGPAAAQPLAAPPLPEAPPQPLPQQPLPPESLPPEASELQLDPLVELLRQDDPRHLIASAHPVPAQGTLELRLRQGFGSLGEAERHAEADRWLERSRALGYGGLILVDTAGQPLGRPAMVGSGMILLDPELPS